MGDMQNAGKRTKKSKLYRYIYNLVVSSSDFIYTLLGGSPRVSLSQMLGFRKITHQENWWSRPLRIIVNSLFRILMNEKNHCEESVLGESNIRGLYKIDKELACHISERTVCVIKNKERPQIPDYKDSPE